MRVYATLLIAVSKGERERFQDYLNDHNVVLESKPAVKARFVTRSDELFSGGDLERHAMLKESVDRCDKLGVMFNPGVRAQR